MSSDADPRGSWAFRRRVALARAAGGFETIWAAAWPSLMVVGAFLVVSLLGLWVTLPAWLHALGLLLFVAALGVDGVAGASCPALAGSQRRAAPSGAGQSAAASAAASARRPAVRRRSGPCDAGAVAAPSGTAPPGGAGPESRAAPLRSAPARSVGAARGDRSPAGGGAGRGGQHGAQAPGPGVRAGAGRPATPWCRSRPRCGSRRRPTPGNRRSGWSWHRPRSAPKRSRSRSSSPCRPAARCSRSSIISGARPTASPSPSIRSGRPSGRSARTAPRPP